MKKALLYFHTLRHLKPVQIFGRIWFHLKKPKTSPPQFNEQIHYPENPLQRLVDKPDIFLPPNGFRFLNEEGVLTGRDDWNHPKKSQLWTYNLHYFHCLQDPQATDKYKDVFLGLMDRWREENPMGWGNGWLPYPLSLRIVNWVKYFLALGRTPDHLKQSLADQLYYQMQRIETHLQGNHYFVNAKALVFGGLFFDKRGHGRAWFERGMKILMEEVPEQVWEDGANYELSPMYHSIFLEDMLDLINLLKAYGETVPQLWLERVSAMLHYLEASCHPDGDIAFFNDAAMGIAPHPKALKAFAQSLGIPWKSPQGCVVFEKAGLARMEQGEVVMLVDGGPTGPDHVFSHAHADHLCFELSYKGQRVFVNTGTSCYGYSDERHQERGTAAHNTVVVDGQDSSQVWAGFRLGKRARPIAFKTSEEQDCFKFQGAHDGYRHLKGGVIHERRISLGRDCLIHDEMKGGGCHEVISFLHLHPRILPRMEDEGCLVLEAGGRPICRLHVGACATLAIRSSYWSPQFGQRLPSKTVTITYEGPLPITLETRIQFL